MQYNWLISFLCLNTFVAYSRAQVTAFRSSVYFVNWAVYERDYHPQDLPVKFLSHVFYAFANISTDGNVSLSDPYADVEQRYHGESENEPGLNMYGAIKELLLLKQQNRHLKVLLSIGGWTYSPQFVVPASTEEGRQAFALSAVRILQDHGFDGLDIDWEYPSTPEQAQDYMKLLEAVRKALDDAANTSQEPPYLLTIACPAGPSNYQELLVQEMDKQLDFWNLMSYDYAGPDSGYSGHHANLYSSLDNLLSTPFNTTDPVKFYLDNDVRASKLNLGVPLYGRAFANTDGLGKPFVGVGEGSFEAGVWDFKDLPRPGSKLYQDTEAGGGWSYDPLTRLLVSHDTPAVVAQKAQYIADVGLGGVIYWESSGDRGIGAGSLMETFINAVGGVGHLESSLNHLNYPNSKYDNVRNGFSREE